jgi:hypothetical protein
LLPFALGLGVCASALAGVFLVGISAYFIGVPLGMIGLVAAVKALIPRLKNGRPVRLACVALALNTLGLVLGVSARSADSSPPVATPSEAERVDAFRALVKQTFEDTRKAR